MGTFAEIALGPDRLIGWVVVGLAAALLASFIMKRGRYGWIGDTMVGLVGAAFGGCLFGLFSTATAGVAGSIAAAFLGACASIVLLRAVARSRTDR